MNNPKVFTLILIFTFVLLIVVLKLRPEKQSVTIRATVISQTLTQSLDGHRRFVNVVTEDQQQFLIPTDPKLDCPKGSVVLLESKQSLSSTLTSYQLIQCLAGATK
ncbi:hypothetical protein [Vibrio ouci]|uniref:Uncharacterized protein n=1 Tax=Vibrio ouci TaxID=2499078 RepID=A0A4Y8WBB4_9VIBR|nr:hypothetical protein [Vibrio ouci]TFH90192.1 hypothetical protein ELS82_18250 [Vibrio ouci]